MTVKVLGRRRKTEKSFSKSTLNHLKIFYICLSDGKTRVFQLYKKQEVTYFWLLKLCSRLREPAREVQETPACTCRQAGRWFFFSGIYVFVSYTANSNNSSEHLKKPWTTSAYSALIHNLRRRLRCDELKSNPATVKPIPRNWMQNIL